MNGIKAIQSNNIYRVNPINLFENRQSFGSSGYNYSNKFSNDSEHNLNYPKHSGSETKARYLDLLA